MVIVPLPLTISNTVPSPETAAGSPSPSGAEEIAAGVLDQAPLGDRPHWFH